jgi:hypothetical protein
MNKVRNEVDLTMEPDDRPAIPARRVELFPTEIRLQMAWRVLGELEEREDLTADQAEAVLAEYVDRDAAVERRDAFVRYLRSQEALAAAKEAEAKMYAEPLLAEASKIRAAADRMQLGVVRLMKRLGVEELFGKIYQLRIKRSRGKAIVFDESAVPVEFWRVKADPDLLAMQKMRDIIIDLLPGSGVDVDNVRALVVGFLSDAEVRRSSVDKVEIQRVWKGNDGSDVRPITKGEADARAALKLEPVQDVPLVPGVRKEVEETLEIK